MLGMVDHLVHRQRQPRDKEGEALVWEQRHSVARRSITSSSRWREGRGGVEELDETTAQDSVWHTSRFCIAESVGLNSMTRVLLVRPLVWGGREAERMIVERGFKTSVESWSSQSLAGFRAIHALTRESGRCGVFASPAHVRSRAARPVSGREQTAKSFKA
jgi:hypothetical protein